jgi:hypothetical protein
LSADIIIRQNDTAPALTTFITDQNGSTLDLTGASVKFIMRSPTAIAPQVSATATITAPTAGQVQYNWLAADTAVPGLYQAVFRVTLASGGTYTYPNDGYLDIWVEEDLTSNTTQYLVSLADAKDHLNIPAADRSRDQKLVQWIEAARPVVEAITGPIVPQLYDEWYDGGQYFIRLRHRPAFLLLACSIYLGPVEYPLAIVANPGAGTIYSAMLDPTGDRVVRRGPGGGIIGFPNMPDSVHVVYKAGKPVIPANVRLGTLMLLAENWEPSQSPGWGSSGREHDEEVPEREPPDFLVSGRVREWLTPNRRHPSVF